MGGHWFARLQLTTILTYSHNGWLVIQCIWHPFFLTIPFIQTNVWIHMTYAHACMCRYTYLPTYPPTYVMHTYTLQDFFCTTATNTAANSNSSTSTQILLYHTLSHTMLYRYHTIPRINKVCIYSHMHHIYIYIYMHLLICI